MPPIYHCISRIVGGEWYLDSRAKEVLRRQLGRVSTFCGVEVLTYCTMSNHFHLLPGSQGLSLLPLCGRGRGVQKGTPGH